MTVLEQVAQLKQQAIELLLNEREQIDSELNQLGYGQENAPFLCETRWESGEWFIPNLQKKE